MVESVQRSGTGPAPEVRRAIVIRKVQQRDIDKALLAGLKDFRTAPRFGVVVGAFHVAIGWMAIFSHYPLTCAPSPIPCSPASRW